MKTEPGKMRRGNAVTCACLIIFLCAALPAWGFDGLDIPQIQALAEKGDAQAQSKLGVMYASGLGMKLDKQQAFKWYAKSAEQGYPVGQWNLAFMYVRGEGTAENFEKARELFRKSAESGFPNAQYDLGMMLLNGLGGQLDREEAERWFQRAADQGYREAKKMLKELGAEKPSDG